MSEPSEQEISDYIDEGLHIGRTGIDSVLAPLLGETPDAWYGAGIMATWILATLTEADMDNDEQLRQTIVVIAVQVRAMRDHPLALAALQRRERANG